MARRPRQYISSRSHREEFDPPPEPVSGFVIPQGGFAGGFDGGGPGRLLRLDFRNVTIQRKPSIADMTALGVPTPTRFYDLTEAAVPFSDGADGAQDFTVLTGPGTLLAQRPMVGLSADGQTFQAYTGIEFSGLYNGNVTSKLEVNNTAFLNVGAAGSGDVVAVGLLMRVCQIAGPAAATAITGRRDPVSGAGWSLGCNAGGALRMLADDGPSGVIVALTANVYSGSSWFFAIGRVRRQGGANDVVEVITVHEVVSANTSGIGSLSNTTPFTLGALTGIQNVPGHTQIAALWTWEGANAAALTQTHARTIFTHAMDPTGLLTTYARAGMSCDQIGYEPGHGYLLGCFSGVSSAGRTAQVDSGYDSDFAHGSGLGIRAALVTQNLVTHSQDFNNAAWTKTNITVGTSIVLMGLGPDKVQNAQRLTASVANGFLQDTIATAAATEYTMSILLRSGTGGNVNARLIQQNITGGVENAGVDIVITTEWQRFNLTATTAAGQVSTGFRLRINTLNDFVFGKLATFVVGRIAMLVATEGAAVTMPATNIQAVSAAGAWSRGAQGEIDVYAVTLEGDETYTRRVLIVRTGATDNNGRQMTINTAEDSTGAVFDSAGATTGTITSAPFDHRVPFTQRLLWRTPSPPIVAPDIKVVLRANAQVINGTNVAFANSDTADTWHIGQSGGVLAQLNGLVALVEAWNQPRPLTTPFP